jgi:hypothetical protein
MKKIMLIIAMFVGISTTSFASNITDPVTLAKEDIKELLEVVEISQHLKNDLLTLFTMKYEALSDINLHPENAQQIRTRFADKFMAGLTDEQISALKKNPELFERLAK